MSLVDKVTEAVGERVALEGESIRDTFRAGLAESVSAMKVTAGARSAVLYPNSPASTGRGRLVGWSIRETAGAAATVTVTAGRDASGDIVATFNLAAGGSMTHLPGGTGIFFGDGIYVAVTGAVAGALYFGAVD